MHCDYYIREHGQPFDRKCGTCQFRDRCLQKQRIERLFLCFFVALAVFATLFYWGGS
jgi:hypothetical protein